MSRLSERKKGASRKEGHGRPAENPKCNVCHRPMKGHGIQGTCQSCMLLQPLPGMWDPNEPPSAEEVAARLPRFEIHEPLGQGALGTVYQATDRVLGRIVAIKVMKANPNNPEFGARFLREASVMAKLNHPNIVAVYDYGVEDDLQYLVMEWMEGGTLEDEGVGHRRLPASRAFSIFEQICEALQHAHQQGVVHRDVKPSNILLDREGNAKLSDFGLVKGMMQDEFREASLTKSNMSVGTPLYMAPEQMKGSSKVDHRADIYSTAAVLYEMLCAESAKDRSDHAGKAEGVPLAVGSSIDRALDPSPDNRYERISKFKTDVVERSGARQRWVRRMALVAGYALFAVVGLLLVAREMANRIEYSRGFSEEAERGMPLGKFEDEIDLREWESLADYGFENGWKDANEVQIDLGREGDAEWENGKLRFGAIADGATVVLSRSSGESVRALLLSLRFMVDEYLGREGASNTLFSLALRHGASPQIALKEPRWGAGQPGVFVGDGEALAPPGVIEAHLTPGEWHDLRLTIDDSGYRVWVDGSPVYHVGEANPMDGWNRWGQERAELWVGGFKGQVDHVRVWEKP